MKKFKNRPNYLDQIALDIREELGGIYTPLGVEVVANRSLYRMYAVLALALGPALRVGDIHNAWVAWQISQDELQHVPEHPHAKVYTELDPGDQYFDKQAHRATMVAIERWNIGGEVMHIAEQGEIEEAVPLFQGGRERGRARTRAIEERGQGDDGGFTPFGPPGICIEV